MRLWYLWKPVVRHFSSGHVAFSDVRVRFAPSPTGMLHLGGLRTALYNYLFAKSHGGKFILRIEDTDQARLVPGAAEKLVDILEWCGIKADEGPGYSGPYGPYTQSERLPIYQQQTQELLKTGHAYRCFCTSKRLELLRKEAARRQETIKYDNKCRNLCEKEIQEKLSAKTPYVVRLKLGDSSEPFQDLIYGDTVHNIADVESDPILVKTNTYPTYHFANVVDDHLMKITHVLRGVEWHSSTPKHLQLYKAFGWTPPKYGHLPLLLNSDGTKLSKRQGDIHVEQFREKGYFVEAVLNFVTYMGGGFDVRDTAGFTLEKLAEKFNLEKIRVNSGKLEVHRLDSLNRIHLCGKLKIPEEKCLLIQKVKQMVSEKFHNRLGESKLQHYLLSDQYIETVLHWSQDRIYKLSELVSPEFEYLWVLPAVEEDKVYCLNLDPLIALRSAVNLIEQIPKNSEHFDQKAITKQFRTLASDSNIKFADLMKLLRMVLSGLKEGPSVGEMVVVLGQQMTLDRLRYGMDVIKETNGDKTKTSL